MVRVVAVVQQFMTEFNDAASNEAKSINSYGTKWPEEFIDASKS
jgi:hypothetical protein